MNMHVRLSATERTALRRAITSHANWPAYVAKQRETDPGFSSANLTSSLCLEVAARFGIDVQAIKESAAESYDAADAGAADHSDNSDKETATMATQAASRAHAASASTNDKASALAAMLAELAGESVNEATVERIVTEKVKAALEGTALVKIELARTDGTKWESGGEHMHPLFEKLLRVLGSRMASGVAPNVWIAGPTGSGKTHAAESAAKALGRPFYFNGALSMAHELLGFVDAGGNYHATAFRQAYEHGGVYLFDEVDASDNAALLALNAALANGVCAFPDKAAPVKRHADFVCIGAANTFGQGATAEFIGRAKIDAAFLSRFPVKFHWTYDIALEQAICGNPAFARRVQAARARAQSAGLKIVIDPRQSQAGAALIAAGMSADEAAEMTYLAGLSADQIRIIEGK